MQTAGRPAAYAALIIFGLFATISALPTTSQVPEQYQGSPIHARPGHYNEALMRSPEGIPWALRNTTSQAAIPYTVPDTTVTLNFTRFGLRIPVVRALSTIFEARQEVLSHLVSNAENATKNDSFEYSAHSSPPETRVCSIFIQAYRDIGLSWVQIDQILQGLTQFSSGAGVDRQPHYQALQFEVSFFHEGTIGYGLSWCTPTRGPAAAENVQTVENPVRANELNRRLNFVSNPANETSLLSNKGNLLSSLATDISFYVVGTNISLTFTWLGNPIPAVKLNSAFLSAFLEMAPMLKESANEPIPNDCYQYTKAVGRAEIAFQIYGMNQMSWRQVNSVMLGLYRFTNGIGTVHEREYYRNLGFDVKDEHGTTIGYGNLLGISSSPAAAAQRRSTTPPSPSPSDNDTLNATSTTTTHLSHPDASIYPIPDSDLTLRFTYLGAALPTYQTAFTLRTALDRVQPLAVLHPDVPIDVDGFEAHIGVVQLFVLAYVGSEVTWRQLLFVLRGLIAFLGAREKRVLVFDIEVRSRGRIGSGVLWNYHEPGRGGGDTINQLVE